jgi:O-antigen ligase
VTIATRLARGVLPAATVAAVLLVLVPGLEAPFTLPKRVVLIGAAGVTAALLPWSRPRRAWAFLAPAISAVASASMGLVSRPDVAWAAVAFGVLAFAWASGGLDAALLLPSMAATGSLVALVALGQAAGVDPFASLAPQAGDGRLRLYATLGNPDFVASALTVVLCLTLGGWALSRTPERPFARPAWLGAAALMIAALAATRSFATVASLGAALAAALAHARRWGGPTPTARRKTLLATALAVIAAASLLAPLAGRSLSAAVEGRVYLWRVVAGHAFDAPVVGLGPGAVEAMWPGWEVEWWRARCGSDALCVAADPLSRFAALQDHAHCDWLELLVERGALGLAAFLSSLGLALRRAWRSSGPLAAASFAAVAALSTRATFDFPLARPADLCLLAAVVGLAFSQEDA